VNVKNETLSDLKMLILTLMLLVSAQVVLADKGHSNEAGKF
jgi:hypothetical protein